MNLSSEDFARAFGDALKAFLDDQRISYTDAAKRLGVTKAALSTYWNNDKNGVRRKARVELLFLACVELGFELEYNGHRVAANDLKKTKTGPQPTSEQLHFDFSRQFRLLADDGLVSIRMKRDPGAVEFSVLLKAAS